MKSVLLCIVLIALVYAEYDPENTYAWGDWVQVGDCYYAANALTIDKGQIPGLCKTRGKWLTTQPQCPGYSDANCIKSSPNSQEPSHHSSPKPSHHSPPKPSHHPTQQPSHHSPPKPSHHSSPKPSHHSSPKPTQSSVVSWCGHRWNKHLAATWGTYVRVGDCCYTPRYPAGVSANSKNEPGKNCKWVANDPKCKGYNCDPNASEKPSKSQPPKSTEKTESKTESKPQTPKSTEKTETKSETRKSTEKSETKSETRRSTEKSETKSETRRSTEKSETRRSTERSETKSETRRSEDSDYDSDNDSDRDSDNDSDYDSERTRRRHKYI